MFFGTHQHTLDAKGRMTIPVRLREGLQDGVVVTRGSEHNLVVYPRSTWAEIAENLAQTSITNRKARYLRRLLFGGAHEVSLDSVGRILLPAFLREWASIESEAILVGAGSFIEVWAPEVWQPVEDVMSEIMAEVEDEMPLPSI